MAQRGRGRLVCGGCPQPPQTKRPQSQRCSPLDVRQERAYSLVERQGESSMGKADIDVLQGTLDLLILKAVSLEAMHGWGIAQRIQQISRDALQVNQGSLYPALHRLEDRGWITAKWGT